MSFNFDFAYKKIVKEIPFKPEWNNGTGYLDGIVDDDLGLAPNEHAKSYCSESKRRILITNYGPLGNVVVFERYSEGGRDIFVGNCRQCLESLIGLGSQVSDDTVGLVFNTVASGTTYSKLQKVINLYNKLEKVKTAA